MEVCISSGATLLRCDKHGSCSYRKTEGEREKREEGIWRRERGIVKGDMGGAWFVASCAHSTNLHFNGFAAYK